MARNHPALAPQHLRGVHSGWDQGGIIEEGSRHFDRYYSTTYARDRNRRCLYEFRHAIPDSPRNFDITYVTYCWEYLINQRQYAQRNAGNSNRVIHGVCDDYTNCFLDQSQNKNGQYKVYEEGPRARGSQLTLFGNSRTYHLYWEDPEVQLTSVALEHPVTAHVVSISVNVLQREDIIRTSLNYCNAALLELYREMNNQDSLQGICEISTPPCSDQKIDDLGDDLQNLTVSKT